MITRQRDKFQIFVVVSSALHLLVVLSVVIVPKYMHQKPHKAALMIELMAFEKPHIRPLQPKMMTPPSPTPPETPVEQPKQAPISPSQNPSAQSTPSKTPLPPSDSVVTSSASSSVPYDEPQMQMAEMGDPRLSFWVRRVRKIMETRWNPPGGLGIVSRAEVKILFTINRGGQISNPSVSQTSGNSDLDQFALQTVQRVGSLPPIPPNFQDKEELSISFTFSYSGE